MKDLCKIIEQLKARDDQLLGAIQSLQAQIEEKCTPSEPCPPCPPCPPVQTKTTYVSDTNVYFSPGSNRIESLTVWSGTRTFWAGDVITVGVSVSLQGGLQEDTNASAAVKTAIKGYFSDQSISYESVSATVFSEGYVGSGGYGTINVAIEVEGHAIYFRADLSSNIVQIETNRYEKLTLLP